MDFQFETQASLVVKELKWGSRGIETGYKLARLPTKFLTLSQQAFGPEVGNIFVNRALQTIEVANQNQESSSIDTYNLEKCLNLS